MICPPNFATVSDAFANIPNHPMNQTFQSPSLQNRILSLRYCSPLEQMPEHGIWAGRFADPWSGLVYAEAHCGARIGVSGDGATSANRAKVSAVATQFASVSSP
jgi:hypothetical protein